MSLQGNLSVARMCKLAEVSRAGFYRFLEQEGPVEQEMELRSLIQQIVLEHKRRYGYRRVAKMLVLEHGLVVNHKKVLRLMREDNLLGLQPRKFVVTTDSQHQCEVYLNLAARMKLSGVNQLWVADITYIRLGREFVYLAVILDAFSRKVVGWELSRRLTSDFCLAALGNALAERQPAAGLVHHSDRGIQYASSDYVKLLEKHGALPSMSRPANPYDNATCESFIKTLKHEEIRYLQVEDLETLRSHLQEFMETYYNRRRLHSALDYCSPEQFEQQQAASTPVGSSKAARLSFSRHGAIYQGNGEQSGKEPNHSPTHCVDESPAGYSWAGCSPAEPACASPAGDDDGNKEEN